ncbi:hypothetical protein [Lysinibacillus sp. RS10]|uniref:hypothetical protein n=1 Tax=Lysinibacillus sp. RS10 TaxID=3242678 RepID=UPI0035BFB68D
MEDGYSSSSLNILSSLRKPFNVFEVENYFRRASKELGLLKPSYKECAIHYIRHLSEKILEDESLAIDIACEIYGVYRDLDYPEELSEWYYISEIIDDFGYGDNTLKLTKEALITSIVKEAESQLIRNSKY